MTRRFTPKKVKDRGQYRSPSDAEVLALLAGLAAEEAARCGCHPAEGLHDGSGDGCDECAKVRVRLNQPDEATMRAREHKNRPLEIWSRTTT